MLEKNLQYYLSLPYPVEITPPEKGDPGYFARIPLLPGCMTQGKNLQQVWKNIQEAKELWLTTAFEDAITIAEPK